MCVVNVARLYSTSTYLSVLEEKQKRRKNRREEEEEEEEEGRVRMSQRRGCLPCI